MEHMSKRLSVNSRKYTSNTAVQHSALKCTVAFVTGSLDKSSTLQHISYHLENNNVKNILVTVLKGTRTLFTGIPSGP